MSLPFHQVEFFLCTQRLRFFFKDYFPALLWTFLNETGTFYFKNVMVKNTITTGTFWYYYPDSQIKAPAVFLLTTAIISANVNTGKRQRCLDCIMERVLIS